MSSASPSVQLPLFSFPRFGEPIRIYAWASVLFLTALVLRKLFWKHKYDAIPALCGTDLFSSYAAASRFSKEGGEWLNSGYQKYRSGVFRIALPSRWHVIVTGDILVEELRKSSDDTLSIAAGLSELFQSKYTMGATILTNRYHLPLLRSQLTRNLASLFSDIRQEIILSIEDNIPLTNEWTSIKAYAVVLQIVSRTSNRIFVGAPLCQNPDYVSLAIHHTLEVSNGAPTINFFPNILKPLAARVLTNVPASVERAVKHIRPLVEERQKKIDEYGINYPEKPVDFLSWLMDEAEGEERSLMNLTYRILHLNFASIHTSSMSFTHALYHLASQPEYIEPLRNEVETIVAEEGWTKSSLTRMRKLDSFFKESQRMNGLGAVSMTRMALKDVTFSDGTTIPRGAIVSAVASACHHDDDIYSNGDTFDGFRFSDLREQGGNGNMNQFVATNPNFIAFGHGSHACPGRFFAATVMKLIMAHLILTYDIKMESEGVRPENKWLGFACRPDTNAELLFRRRQV
ncbi:cytochrome P450 [Gautieria morchelliformis]|nr:cytochrome P450 [Gautieria morchelliformis]